MNSAQHLFISHSANLPENWRKVFPSAHCASLQHRREPDMAPGMMWLRLSGDATVAQQINAARANFGALPLIVLSDIPSDLEALAVFSASARGYCNTHAGEEVLRNVASVVGQGGLWIGESIMQRLLATPVAETPGKNADWAAALTERETEVAQAVARGASNKEIAQDLGITERTVKAHVGAVLEKLKVRDRLQLALLVKDS